MLDVVGFTIKEAIKILQEHKKSYTISQTYPIKVANIMEEPLFVVKQTIKGDEYLLLTVAKMRKEV